MNRTFLGGKKVEIYATNDLEDLASEHERLETRAKEIDSELGTIASDVMLQERRKFVNRDYPETTRAVEATLIVLRERRDSLIKEAAGVQKQISQIKEKTRLAKIAADRSVAAAGELDMREAAARLLDAFNKFDELDSEYRTLRHSFNKPKNTWPYWLIALQPFQRERFRSELRSFIQKGN